MKKMYNLNVRKITPVSKGVSELGLYYGVDTLKQKRFIKILNNNATLTKKGIKELQIKRKEFPNLTELRNR